jgi:hypothetical protein
MRILFDQGTPVPIRRALTGSCYQDSKGTGVEHSGEWRSAARRRDAGFELLLTTDTNFPYQQSLQTRKLAVVILTRNKWSLVRTVLPKIVEAVNVAKPGTFTIVEVPQK